MATSRQRRVGRFGDWADVRSLTLSGKLDGRRPFFAGSRAYDRMDLVRQGINDVRASWHRYPELMEELRHFMRLATVDVSDAPYNARLTALLSSIKEWTTSTEHIDLDSDPDGYEAIRLYTSSLGYRQIFSVINAAFRSDDLVSDKQRLRSAAFLVELLNIDLFNYRARHTNADNFSGTVYRGMCVSGPELSLFERVAVGPLEERYLSIPLAMVSATTDRRAALAFARAEAQGDSNKHAVLWEIQVESLPRELLSFYLARFPDSVVTSLCAVPIAPLSDYQDEKEVLLRGPFFQILRIGADDSETDGRAIHKVEAVTLTANRDHLSAIASNEGVDRQMRDLFRAIILAYRSKICADRAEQAGQTQDASRYQHVASENFRLMESFRQ